jgi:hypothetical protein
MHPIQKLFLESCSYELQFDMHFYMHSYLHKNFIPVKSGCYILPGLDRSIIEHQLPLKKGFRPFQQRAHQMRTEALEEVKKEIEKMLEAGFIRPCRYAEWISSIVPVQKKDG